MNTRFSCVGCGKCCNDHYVPLTLDESRQWAADGGIVIVLVEAFLENGHGVVEAQFEHARRRSVLVASGTTQAWLAVTFAAYNNGPCRNLDADNRCGIYERRPLVCRIYPAEINPHIPLRTDRKDCPPESWEQGQDLIVGGKLVDQELAELIERSRQADREDIGAKAAICARLGISTTALKGNGFATYLPDMQDFMRALEEINGDRPASSSEQQWAFQLADEDSTQALLAHGATIAQTGTGNYRFIPLRSPD
ncbi:YkgJ family cysteine cluster protein [Pseudomonas gingeri]|uniref:YkgJ family cysteine cluster protein n=1 Tax=Pseudomonas gingeri TaxID=117681 RepID=A0A7Y7XEJ5_9PSED|nr:YkgJ family cysteine cluster protein [Pseudomonas gingeri]NWB98390.1 YkgJ family cysteine cluster protein [Pseudomonas gingeri]NWD71479.1 YkgJ family cysteine cluster protein [Pseudomonas gingeri]